MNILKRLWQDEKGMGLVEVAIIIIIVIALGIFFKEQITALLERIFATVNMNINRI